MGVTYKLREEVVDFIVLQRRNNPLASCRELAEGVEVKFGLRLSKSSVHDVLKESGIVTPRGRKPKNKFEIPLEKKKQIQNSLSLVKLTPMETKALAPVPVTVPVPLTIPVPAAAPAPVAPPAPAPVGETAPRPAPVPVSAPKVTSEISLEYPQAGKVFLKAALWDLGVYSDIHFKEEDWDYYLTYAKGIRVNLEGDQSYFIDLPLPIERCIKEAADGLITNIRPMIIHKVSDENLLKASMEAKTGYKIHNILIVDQKDHILLNFEGIVDCKRQFLIKNRLFVYNSSIMVTERAKALFFTQTIDNDNFKENICNLYGFDTTNQYERTITLLIGNTDASKQLLQDSADRFNAMYLRDEQDRLVLLKIQEKP